MGFGGGGGSTGVTAHKHTNNLGDGSTLDNTSLIDNINLRAMMLAL